MTTKQDYNPPRLKTTRKRRTVDEDISIDAKANRKDPVKDQSHFQRQLLTPHCKNSIMVLQVQDRRPIKRMSRVHVRMIFGRCIWRVHNRRFHLFKKHKSDSNHGYLKTTIWWTAHARKGTHTHIPVPQQPEGPWFNHTDLQPPESLLPFFSLSPPSLMPVSSRFPLNSTQRTQ